MQIGQVIREYRKRKELTQEEMASRLGVTAPAVNKWENGNSYPDITLLAPIARLLEVSLDELLSFRRELSKEEINNIVYELDSKLKSSTYEEAFRWAGEVLTQYGNCYELILSVAVVLDAWQMTRKIRESGETESAGPAEGELGNYEDCINRWYIRVLESEDEDIRVRAADALFGFYQRKEQYEKAEEYLAYFSKQSPERKRKQAVIYSKTGRRKEAYKAYEEILFSGYQTMSIVLHGIYMLAIEDENMEKVRLTVEKQKELARAFDMGAYYEASSELELEVLEKNADAVIETVEKMLSSVEEITNFRNSPLYEHLTFKPVREEFLSEIKRNLQNGFRDEETFGFLKDNQRWQELVGDL